MNVMQLNTDIYNSLGVLSNTEWFVLEHNNAESCRHHCQQDPTLVLFKQILHFNFLLNNSTMFAIRHPSLSQCPPSRHFYFSHQPS